MKMRRLSYGDIAELQYKFEEQCKQQGVVWTDDEVRDECLFDFIGQYGNWIDEPKVRLLGYGYEIV